MIRNFIFVCLIALVLILVVQNTQVVEFRFLLWTISMSRALMLFGTLAIGFIAGWLLTSSKGKKKYQHESKSRK
jgi:putative membrane protein